MTTNPIAKLSIIAKHAVIRQARLINDFQVFYKREPIIQDDASKVADLAQFADMRVRQCFIVQVELVKDSKKWSSFNPFTVVGCVVKSSDAYATIPILMKENDSNEFKEHWRVVPQMCRLSTHALWVQILCGSR